MRPIDSACRWAAILCLALPPSQARADGDEFLAMQASPPSSFNYARVSEIQVFLDASPTRCSVFLANGQEIKAFQTCASITVHLEQRGLVTLPSTFGTVLLAPAFVSSLIAMNNGSCRLNLQNGVWVPVVQNCRDVLRAFANP
jgi:hypothetical protein